VNSDLRNRYPALTAWWRERKSGERTTATRDPLWEAACREANARDFADIPELHDACMRDAKAIIGKALQEQQRQKGVMQ
jgi:hypothetical protein